MTEVLLIQAIGFAGMAASLISFQYKEHGKVLFLRILSEIIFAVQYVFLGAYTGMASNLMSAVMNLFFKSRVKGGKSTLAYQIGFSLFPGNRRYCYDQSRRGKDHKHNCDWRL